ncbi:MAG TPA: right-handed parallel beta-helix repeat-containing protein [Saprospiraceae bacterium]|nr:right-handed parallel beta-helix repeat-containing protein [Saprospiraceae bacterium]HNT20563.1 right-handed parallel beta-helix repeat-containing protein [Saprospiraceae bacterium]
MKMKALSLFALISLVLVFTNCNRDQDLTLVPDDPSQAAQAWTPSEGMSPFLSAETRAQMPAEDLEFVDRILKNPSEDMLRSRGAEVHIPAGSVNALQAAIDAANPGDVIVLDAGDHSESGSIKINKPVTLMGETGTKLIFSNLLPGATFTSAIQVVAGAEQTVIRNIHFTSTDPISGVCIFADALSQVKILRNIFENFVFTIVGYQAQRFIISQNKITVGTGGAHGIMLSDGDQNIAVLNEISNGMFGIFAGGTNGISFSNTTNNNLYGQVLCKVPPGQIIIDGTSLDTQGPTVNWSVKYNEAHNNLAAGYLVVDGSHNNFLIFNNGFGNGTYDIELTSDTERFGFLAPASHNNRVVAYRWLTVKDCGDHNIVNGGKRVSIILDPCN